MTTRIRGFLTAVAVVPISLLASCSTKPLDAAPAEQASAPACTRVANHWPHTVAGDNAYPVTTSSDAVRAWGDDVDEAVVARCGVESPGPTTDACIQVDDIDWVQSAISSGYRFVTYGRQPAIEVLVPKSASDTPGIMLPAFTSAARAIPQGSHHCQ